jgi:hypothetical protein
MTSYSKYMKFRYLGFYNKEFSSGNVGNCFADLYKIRDIAGYKCRTSFCFTVLFLF